jgi:hypothetical protein
MEEEKRAFKQLIDMKPHLMIDLKDYRIEDQMKQLEIQKNQDKNTRQAGGQMAAQDQIDSTS